MKYLPLFAVLFSSTSAMVVRKRIVAEIPDENDTIKPVKRRTENVFNDWDTLTLELMSFDTGASTPEPTSAPTDAAVTAQPTEGNNNNSNEDTTPDECRIVGSSFGSISGDSVNINFVYELESSPSGDLNEMQPRLEDAMANFLLPTLFPSLCVSASGRRLKVVGLTTLPEDTLRDQQCSGLDNPSNSCVVVDGKMTIFVESDAEVHEQQTKEALKAAMMDGVFNSAHPAIERVSWVDPDDSIINGPNEVITSGDDTRVLSAGVLGFIIAGAAMLLFFLAALLYRRNKEEKEDEIDPESTLAPDLEAETAGAAMMSSKDTDDHSESVDQAPPLVESSSSTSTDF